MILLEPHSFLATPESLGSLRAKTGDVLGGGATHFIPREPMGGDSLGFSNDRSTDVKLKSDLGQSDTREVSSYIGLTTNEILSQGFKSFKALSPLCGLNQH